MSVERLADRSDLLHAFDTLRRDFDARRHRPRHRRLSGPGAGDRHVRQVRDAFDLDQEPAADARPLRRGPFRHGPHPGPHAAAGPAADRGGRVGRDRLLHSGWDTHRDNFTTLREMVPPLDQALHALVTDLDERGLLDDVVIVMGGEFGRTPRIGDRLPTAAATGPTPASCGSPAADCGPARSIGATDARGEQVVGKPIRHAKRAGHGLPAAGHRPRHSRSPTTTAARSTCSKTAKPIAGLV